jgi:succinate-semialdehyde dehydrogenase
MRYNLLNKFERKDINNMDTISQITEMVLAAKEAQSIIDNYSQKQIDAVVKAIGKVIYDNAEILAIEAVEESGLGNVESKIAKQRGCAVSHWSYLKNKRTVGIIDEDPVNNIVTYAKAIGVIAIITPSTNPTTTLCSNAMSALKCRNAIICSPHPKTSKVTTHGVTLMRKELKNLGAPENLIQIIEEPTLEATLALLSLADASVATGGMAMVKSAYSSGKPSYGVGSGNVQVIIDEGYDEDLNLMAANTIANRNRDYGLPCVCEQCLIIHKSDEDRIFKFFEANGAFIIKDNDNVEKIRKLLFKQDRNTGYILNIDMIGKPAVIIANEAGINVPKETKILIVKAEGNAMIDPLCKEKLEPVCSYLTYETFDEAVNIALTNLKVEGIGHTSVIYSTNENNINKAGEILPVSRILVNCSSSNASGAAFNIGYNPTASLGCGFWGNNSVSENITYKHMMQTTQMARIIPNLHIPTPEEVWED